MKSVLQEHLKGLFDMPGDISPTAADVAWFRKHAKVYQPPFHQFPNSGEDNQCWMNAALAAYRYRDLRYVQGFVKGHFQRDLFLHAWCVDHRERVFETTWNVAESTGSEIYIGVPFTWSQLEILHRETQLCDWYDGFADILTRFGAVS